MKRRKFTKSSLIGVAGAALLPSACRQQPAAMKRQNWAGNLTYSTETLSKPADLQSLAKAIREKGKLKALGTCHSFNTIADSEHEQISLRDWNHAPVLDEANKTVTIDANMRYGELATWLHARGYAIHNLASLPHISVAGACATATHGSGDRLGNLATAVVGYDIMRADGTVETLDQSSDPQGFNASLVGLGAVGIITKMTLQVEPTFEVRQDLYQYLPLESLQADFDRITSSGYSVSLFTDWQSDHVNQVWVKSKLVEGEDFEVKSELFGAKAATQKLHPIIEISPVHCTEQLGSAGPWHERLPHFKLEFTPSSGEELQSEYFVPRTYAVDAIMAIYALGKQVAPQILISEIRTIAKDELWMSPCYQQDCIAIHFTWKQNIPEVTALLSVIEEALMPFEVRPHWGKLFNLPPAHLSTVYRKMDDFKDLIRSTDPTGKFRNRFIDERLFG